MSTVDEGFLSPNPILLFEQINSKKTSRLAHQLGEGSPCIKCLDKCPGFQLHFWRKVCSNCRCGKCEHNVVESVDHSDFFVGKIFDRPLRSRKEEDEFSFGRGTSDALYLDKKAFDWVPRNTSKALIRRYMDQLPKDHVPIAGSEGAQLRQRNLERQFPVHDMIPSKCHDLTPSEIGSMNSFISKVKDENIGVGVVHEVGKEECDREITDVCEDFPPPPSEEELSNRLSSKLSITKPGEKCEILPKNGHDRLVISDHLPVSSSNIKKNLLDADGIRAHNDKFGGCCEFCHDGIRLGDVAVLAERAGRDKRWHPQCFKCSECKEILVDLLYYCEDGSLYCARDFASLCATIPRCSACDELIFATEYTGAEGKTWHFKHFCCWNCDAPLAGKKYVSVDSDKPHCLECYQQKHGKTCIKCNKYVNPEEQRITLDVYSWHATKECFNCVVCMKTLLGEKFLRNQGLLFCSGNCKKQHKTI